MDLFDTHQKRLAPFEEVVGPLSPTAPTLGEIAAFLGHLGDWPVRIYRTRGPGDHHSLTWLAMSVDGHPLEGHILTDHRLRDRPPVEDDKFFEVFKANVTPKEVGRVALATPEARAAVQRLFRGGAGTQVILGEGYLRTSADFHVAPRMMQLRVAEVDEVRELVDDVALLADRFRIAFETVRAEIAETDGEAAAQAWVARAVGVRDASVSRRFTVNVVLAVAALGLVSTTLLMALSAALLMALVF